MKWLPLSVDNYDAIRQQIEEVTDLYSVLFLKVQHEKQRLLHLLFSNKSQNDREFLKQEEGFFDTLDRMGNLDESFDDEDINNMGLDSKINKEKVLNSLHHAIENRMNQLEQFYFKDSNSTDLHLQSNSRY
jgi:Tfp pilus assembly PilM family ATPase